MINATVKIILEGKPMSNGKHRVYLRIIKDRKKKDISLRLECQQEHFQSEQFSRKHKNHQTDNALLLRFKMRAVEIIRAFQFEGEDFTLEQFKTEFKNTKSKQCTVKEFCEEIMAEMNEEGRISSSKAYRGTLNTLLLFGGDNLTFSDINYAFLKKYEVFLKSKPKSNGKGGVAFKMRVLRAILNRAIKNGIVPKDKYPFKDYVISGKTQSRKIALSLDEFKKFKDVDLTNRPDLMETYMFFIFSFYTRGMNFKDMMVLKWSNILNNRISYKRSKTKERSMTNGLINLEVLEPVREILDHFKVQNRPTDYVFPVILKNGLTPQQIFNRKHKVLSRYNKRLKEIAKLAGINKNITSYTARHSFATILKQSGTSVEKISEMMGHTDVSITIAYLKEFSNEELDVENRKLLEI